MCDARKRAAWKGWREEYPELNDQDIVDALVERFNLSEATRYRLYNEARLFRRKKFSKTEKGEMRIHIL